MNRVNIGRSIALLNNHHVIDACCYQNHERVKEGAKYQDNPWI